MAQSAIGKNPLHIEGYWEKPSSEAPDWDLWLPQFKFALFTKEEIQHSALIGPKPAKVTKNTGKRKTPQGRKTRGSS